jgi:hypothetical protein
MARIALGLTERTDGLILTIAFRVLEDQNV